MSEAHLRFSASILKRLGEELNPHVDQGILELAKNAYDADAKVCAIRLIKTNQPGGAVSIEDDGVGMSQQEVQGGWLVLGHSEKSADRPTEKLGRIPVGNKGLGRLAALRLGKSVELTTRPEKEPRKKYSVSIDWSRFDNCQAVEDVELDIKESRRKKVSRHGTSIIIKKLDSKISRMDVKRLARGLLLLAAPFREVKRGFRPVLKAPEFRDLEKLVKRRYFDDAELRLTAEVDSAGRATARVVDWKGKALFTAAHDDLCIHPTKKNYGCPPAKFSFWVFILDKQKFLTRKSSLKEVQEWLAEFGGVHLYIKEIRVSPYGNPGNDWLEINLSRVRSPELRPSTNTSIGRILISDDKGQLRQKTDRTGIYEGGGFDELKRFAIDALNWMARRRVEERDRLRTRERTGAAQRVHKSKGDIVKAIEKLPRVSKQRLKKRFEQYEFARKREVQSLRKEVQLYRTMSTAGITSAVFAHESKQPIKLIIRNAGQVEKKGKKHLKGRYASVLEAPVLRIVRQANTLGAFSNMTLSLVDHDKRRSGRVDIHEAIRSGAALFDSLARDRIVDIQLELDTGSPYLRGSQAAIESIVTNLIANSFRALEKILKPPRKILIRTFLQSQSITIKAMDNGPGIHGVSLKEIWLPGVSTYATATGLGLAIVRDTVTDLGGSAAVIKAGEFGGAEFTVELPVIRS
ncbi:MAG: sensor histidine kinase [Elusimicrobiota bacterium]